MKPTSDYYVEKLALLVTPRKGILFTVLVAATLVFTGVNRYFSGKGFFTDMGDYVEIGVEMAVLAGVGLYLLWIIAKRSEAMQILQESETRYRSLFEVSPHPMFLHKDGRIIQTNPAGVRFHLAAEADELLGQPILDLVHPDYRETVLKRLKRLDREQDSLATQEIRVLRFDGTTAEVETASVVTTYHNEPAVLTVGYDVTERNRAKRALVESEHRYRQLFDVSPDTMIVHRQGKILLANEAASRSLRMKSPQEMAGKSVFDFIPSHHHQMARQRFDLVEAQSSAAPLLDMTFVRSDGTSGYGEAIAVPTTFEGEPAALSVVRDVTERRRAERALRESERKYRLLVDNAHEGIFVTQDGMLRFVNPRVVEGMEYSEEELLQKPFVEVVYPDDREEVVHYHLRRMSGDEVPWRRSFRVITGTGKVKWIEMESVLITWEGKPAGLCFTTDITDRKLAEEALRESQKLYRDLVENANDIIYVTDADGYFVLMNPVGLRTTGYSLNEITSKHYLDLIPAEYKQQVEKFYGVQFVKGIPDTYYEVPIITKQGETAWIGQSVQLVFEGEAVVGFQAICRDVTDRKIAEEALRESEERYRAVFNNAAAGINLSDREGRFLQVNSKSASMFGYTREELLRMSFFDITHPEDADVSRKHLLELVHGKKDFYGLEKRYVRKDGIVIWADIYVSAIRDAKGEYAATLAVVVDITDRKRSEQERESLREQLLQAQKMEAIGTLAGGIAHEFNNLLTVVSGYTELLLQERDARDPARADLQKIASAAISGAELVHKLRTFGRKAEYQFRPMNLNNEVKEVVKFLSKTISRTIEIQCNLAADLTAINADSAQMEQMFINLVLNSRDAMPEGGKLVVETGNVTLGKEYCSSHVGAKPGDYVMLKVADSGHGMDEATRKRIFEPFFTTRGLAERSGLGLAVVHGIVEKHGGHIDCESKPGEGTTFTIYLPVLTADEDQQELVEEAQIRAGTETLLLVDDEELITDLGKRMLTRAGYTVLTACSGKDAKDVFNANKDEISLVILDLSLPGIGGKQCLREIMEIDSRAKVLIASGYTDLQKKEELIEAGARGFITKPFSMPHLLGQVREILDAA
ncbi:MAG: PAS domain S-box protein [Desulfomonile tiedjei]|nr:PAS domain S-box protein [Desulfomonile tiedjei]